MTKELVAIGAAITAHCQPCLEYHTAKARELGVSEENIAEAVKVGQQVQRVQKRLALRGRGLLQRFGLLPEPAFISFQAALRQLGALGFGNHAGIQRLQCLVTRLPHHQHRVVPRLVRSLSVDHVVDLVAQFSLLTPQSADQIACSSAVSVASELRFEG